MPLQFFAGHILIMSKDKETTYRACKFTSVDKVQRIEGKKSVGTQDLMHFDIVLDKLRV